MGPVAGSRCSEGPILSFFELMALLDMSKLECKNTPCQLIQRRFGKSIQALRLKMTGHAKPYLELT